MWQQEFLWFFTLFHHEFRGYPRKAGQLGVGQVR
jgi:hypothetical protein